VVFDVFGGFVFVEVGAVDLVVEVVAFGLAGRFAGFGW
jgi:hypothetical protein